MLCILTDLLLHLLHLLSLHSPVSLPVLYLPLSQHSLLILASLPVFHLPLLLRSLLVLASLPVFHLLLSLLSLLVLCSMVLAPIWNFLLSRHQSVFILNRVFINSTTVKHTNLTIIKWKIRCREN